MNRRFQSGSVKKRGKRNPVWEGRYYEPVLAAGNVKKVRRSVILGPCSRMSRSEARQRFQDILRPLNEGLHGPVASMTFAEFAEKWEKEILENYRPSTRAFYKGTLARWILPYFRKWPLGDVKTPDVQTFVNRFRGSYSVSVLKHIRATLSVVFKTAVAWQYVERNPAIGLRLPQGKGVKRARILSPAEVRLLTANLKEPYRTMVVVLAGSVLRASELLALKWEDIDFSERIIKVRRSLYRGKIDETKTEKSNRDIPLGAIVEKAVLAHRKSPFNRGEYVFLTERGKHFQPTRVERRAFKPAAESLGLQPFSWRSFRRAGATAIHNDGTPLKVQQDIMGHTTPEMSMLYTAAELTARRQAIARLEETMFGVSDSFANGRELDASRVFYVQGRPN